MSFINKYDKIKLLVNRPLTINYSKDYGFTVDSNDVFKQLNHTDLGLSISIDLQKNNTTITFSSKILRSQTARLISTDTIEDVYSIIANVVDISHTEFYKATVLTAEVTHDVRFVEPDVLIDSMFRLAKLQTGYKVAPKPHKHRKKSCSFWMKKSNSNRRYIDFLSIYDKKAEFLSQNKKANQDLYQALTPEQLSSYLQEIENIVRFEVKLNSAYMLRKHYGLADSIKPTLETLLNSEVQVVKNMVERLFSGLAVLTEKEFKAKNRAQLADYLALRENDFDLEKTLAYLQGVFGTIQRSREEKRLRSVLSCISASTISSVAIVYLELLKLM